MEKPLHTLKDLEMPDDEPMVIIRSSLLWICDGDKYAAAALNMYIHWTRWLMKHKPVAQKINQMQKKQGKTPTQDTSLVIYRKQAELVEDLLYFCNEKRLRQANAFLVSKGLLKIEDTPRHIADHVLKYELQISTFKELMNDWRKYREGNPVSEEDEVIEVALEEDGDGTDNSPLGSRQLSDDPRSRNGQFTARNGQFTAPIVIDDKKETIRDNRKRGSTALCANNNASSVSENVKEITALTEREQQIIKWFCEVAHVRTIRITVAAQECLSAIGPDMETREDVRGLYKQTKMDIDARNDARNKTVFFANMKDSLFNWKQNKPAQVVEVALPVLTEEEAVQEVLWTRRPSKIEQMIANGRDTIEDHQEYLEWMPLHEARDYYYGLPGARCYTPEEIERYKQLAGQEEPKRLRLL